MRTRLMLAAAGLAIVTASAQPSSAEVTYAWCAVYAENDAVRNCGFATYEQCRAAISGKIDLDRDQMLCDRRTHGFSAVGFRDLPRV